MPTTNVLTASFNPHAIDYIQIQIGIFPPLSTPVHIKQKKKSPLRKDVSAHSNDLPSKLLAHATKQTLYSSAAWEASHKQRQCCTVRVSSHQRRADGVSVSRAAEGLLHAFMWIFTYLTQCLKVAVLSPLLRIPEPSRANITNHSASHGWIVKTIQINAEKNKTS